MSSVSRSRSSIGVSLGSRSIQESAVPGKAISLQIGDALNVAVHVD